MDGQQQGLVKIGLFAQKQTGTNGAGSGRELGKILSKPTNTSEGKYGAQFWLNARKFPDVQERCITAAFSRQNGLFHHDCCPYGSKEDLNLT
jgi:hypothetical protein